MLPHKQIVLVLDFGAQYSQLIARRVRECRVYSEIVPPSITAEEIKRINPKAIILSGGPNSVFEEGSLKCDPEIFNLGIPILGICYGHQLISYMLNGEVRRGEKAEYGKTELFVIDDSDIFAGLNPDLIAWMSHSDIVVKPPPGFKVTAYTRSTPVAAMSCPERKIFGVQFHPEVVHTPWGIEVIRNFLYNQAGCEPLWTTTSYIQSAIEYIKEVVKDGGKVICALSGGVDSAVTAVLVHKVVGDNLYCIFVNHGLLRKGEVEDVLRTFRENFKMNLIYVNGEERFFSRLKGVTDPEEKRRIIGEEFVKVFEEEASKLEDVRYLAQGTLYPDVIESGTERAARIKTHHNVGGLPLRMKLKLIEPLRYLFKDEVRQMGEELGLSSDIVWRHPFPGPGLAIRIIGEVTPLKAEILREADAIVVEEIKKAGLYRSVWQSFAVLLPVRTVGVMGDRRTYDYTIAVRVVSSEDAMTADWVRLPYEVLENISNRITREVQGVNRVVYDISSKPPATIEWE
ncbi:glutamine-hydrolyzing GMP synthase [bacterium]|nr:glutamine-hydrolyzing GMP synthase [bacterium]